MAKFDKQFFKQKKFFWHDTCSCTCSVYLYCLWKVSESFSKSSGTSWFPCIGWGWKRKAWSCPRVLLPWGHALCRRWLRAGCELAAITSCKCAWGKFRQLLPLLTNRHLPLLTRGKVYSSCVRSVMLHAAETWAMKVDTLNRLQRNDPLDLQCQGKGRS